MALLNDRLGAFHEAPILGVTPPDGLSGLLTTHLDTDGRADVVAANSSGPVQAWRNTTERTVAEKTQVRFESWPINASRWSSAQVVDLDLDGRMDLLGLPAESAKRTGILLAVVGSQRREAVRRAAAGAWSRALPDFRELVAVDLAGDPVARHLHAQAG